MDVAGVVSLLDLVGVPACLLDGVGGVEFVNVEWQESINRSAPTASTRLPTGEPWLNRLAVGVRGVAGEALAEACAGRTARFHDPTHEPRHTPTTSWEYTLTPVGDVDRRRPTTIVCVAREMADRRSALVGLRLSQERLALAAHVGGLGVWDYDIADDVLHCDEQWHRIDTGDSSHDPISTMAQFRLLIHPEDVEAATEVTHTAEQLLALGEDYAIEFRIRRPTGDIRWVRSVACLQESNGIAVRAVGFIVDITESRLIEQALREANAALERERRRLTRLSLQDPLTGIANRRYLDEELARRCRRGTTVAEPLCIGLIDVDLFKAYNDRYGHLEGDSTLRRLATALVFAARESDVMARYGGEEFAFVISGVSNPTSLLNRFMQAVADLAIAHPESPTGQLTISAGCVVFHAQANIGPSALLRRADDALYRAKTAGRNIYVIDTEPPRAHAETQFDQTKTDPGPPGGRFVAGATKRATWVPN